VAVDTLEAAALVGASFPGGVVGPLVAGQADGIGVLRRQLPNVRTGNVHSLELLLEVLVGLRPLVAGVAALLQGGMVGPVEKSEVFLMA
jgi:hypothetical protein